MEYMEYLQVLATRYALFGWVQLNNKNNIVGEFRGNKLYANKFSDIIKTCPEEYGEIKVFFIILKNVFIKKYDDTRIKYHFTHFRILLDGRETCFNDPPHQCDDNVNNEL